MMEKSLSEAFVFIFPFHLLAGNQLSNIMSILLRSTHIKDLKSMMTLASTVGRHGNGAFGVVEAKKF
jgi:hypothetical protein